MNDNEAEPALLALIAIQEKHGKERGVSGSIPCTTPGCGGTVRYSIARSKNWHPRAHCAMCGLGFIV